MCNGSEPGLPADMIHSVNGTFSLIWDLNKFSGQVPTYFFRFSFNVGLRYSPRSAGKTICQYF